MWHRVSKLHVELIDETLDQPIAVDGIVYDLLHGPTDGEEVLVLFVLKNIDMTGHELQCVSYFN